MGTALITGGTSGLGAAYARALAERGDDLVLVARDLARLESEAQLLREAHGVQVEVLQADLADRTQVQTVAARLESSVNPITTFVNNAGFGLHTDLLSPDTEHDERAFDVMVRAVFLLGGAAARAMLQRGSGEILNTSSAAAFITTGNYSAVKAWVLTYSEGLATQLAGTAVHVTAFCPGWVPTEFHERADINITKLPSFVWIDADKAVRQGLDHVAKGKVICVPGPIGWKLAVGFARYAPRRVIRWASGKLVRSRAKTVDAH